MDEGWYIEGIIQRGKSQGVGRKVFVLIWFRENDSDCEIFWDSDWEGEYIYIEEKYILVKL